MWGSLTSPPPLLLFSVPGPPPHPLCLNRFSTLLRMEFVQCGWVDLPKCQKRCWFAHLPPTEELQNYITIMDDFGVNLEQAGHTFQHLMMW